MIQPLTPQQIQWVDTTLRALNVEQADAQLLNVSQPMDSAQWLAFLERVPVVAMSARVPRLMRIAHF
ncbi:MAG: hypothetical protein R2867_45250 [Caldilineaceae bacterium]